MSARPLGLSRSLRCSRSFLGPFPCVLGPLSLSAALSERPRPLPDPASHTGTGTGTDRHRQTGTGTHAPYGAEPTKAHNVKAGTMAGLHVPGYSAAPFWATASLNAEGEGPRNCLIASQHTALSADRGQHRTSANHSEKPHTCCTYRAGPFFQPLKIPQLKIFLCKTGARQCLAIYAT